MSEKERPTGVPSKLAHLPRRSMFAKPEDIQAKADRAAKAPRPTPAQLRALEAATKAAADRAEKRSTSGSRSRSGSSATAKKTGKGKRRSFKG